MNGEPLMGEYMWCKDWCTLKFKRVLRESLENSRIRFQHVYLFRCSEAIEGGQRIWTQGDIGQIGYGVVAFPGFLGMSAGIDLGIGDGYVAVRLLDNMVMAFSLVVG